MIKRFHWPKLIATTAVACVTLSNYAIAGGPRSDAARDSFRQSGMSPSSRFDMRNNSGSPDDQSNPNQSNSGSDRERSRDQSSDTERTRDADSGADAADTSESSQSTAAHSEANDSEHRSSGSSFIHRANDERAVEIHEAKSKDGESERAQHSTERSEVSKKFDSSMLLADVAPNTKAASALGHIDPKQLQHEKQKLEAAQDKLQRDKQILETERARLEQAKDKLESGNFPPGEEQALKAKLETQKDEFESRKRDFEREKQRFEEKRDQFQEHR